MIQKGCWCRVYETKIPLLKQWFKGIDIVGRVYIRFYDTGTYLRFQLSGNETGFHSICVDETTAQDIMHCFPFIKVEYR